MGTAKTHSRATDADHSASDTEQRHRDSARASSRRHITRKRKLLHTSVSNKNVTSDTEDDLNPGKSWTRLINGDTAGQSRESKLVAKRRITHLLRAAEYASTASPEMNEQMEQELPVIHSQDHSLAADSRGVSYIDAPDLHDSAITVECPASATSDVYSHQHQNRASLLSGCSQRGSRTVANGQSAMASGSIPSYSAPSKHQGSRPSGQSRHVAPVHEPDASHPAASIAASSSSLDLEGGQLQMVMRICVQEMPTEKICDLIIALCQRIISASGSTKVLELWQQLLTAERRLIQSAQTEDFRRRSQWSEHRYTVTINAVGMAYANPRIPGGNVESGRLNDFRPAFP
ncbi:hypothetical protein CERSUDRAFT_74748 [Gelatoporia subvermispora B]|uniref:Uncharacterized protein n=1 Tax=Ceriporiopsis subvermispora (strain B) TaxID=914234 RepID=M2RC61_CERS8|nr:hypothetical protein CERSUDRAFT_74748 [Gelatoporia subvermispora B]